MPARNLIPWRERCAGECGARRAPDGVLCYSCRRRNAGIQGPKSPMELPTSSGGTRDAHADAQGSRTVPASGPRVSPEALQDNERRELTRCVYCGQSNFAHLSDCEGRIEDMDATSEYRADADAAEMDA